MVAAVVCETFSTVVPAERIFLRKVFVELVIKNTRLNPQQFMLACSDVPVEGSSPIVLSTPFPVVVRPLSDVPVVVVSVVLELDPAVVEFEWDRLEHRVLP